MDSASQEIYFQKLQELVQDDDKIVTVSSLASDLGISVQNSRDLISKYVEDQRKLRPDDLAVTYVVSGTLKENAKKGVFMVKENDLKERRKVFEANPCEIIYSVQKNKNMDFNIIALMDMFSSTKIRETALNGSIVSKNCIKRTLKFKRLPSPPPPTLKGKSSFFTPKVEASTSSEKSSAPSKTDQKAKASGGIADLFKAAASKPKNGNGATPTKPKPAVKSGGIAGFFTNGALKSPRVTNKNGTENEKKTIKMEYSSSNSESQISIKDEILDVIDVDVDEEPVKIKEESNVAKSDSKTKIGERKNNSQEKSKKANKRQRDKSREVPSKRRKRIIERNSSDSDDMFEKDSEEDIIGRSDEEPERVLSPVVQKPILPKNKRRKAVTRTYKDEEDFIVTRTEYIYETASEDENVEPAPVKQEKKEEKPVMKSKAPDKKKPAKNQATLMSFFTKK